MKIENLRTENTDNRVRVAATVIWEDCDRPVQELYFETQEEFANSLSCNPHAFLVACIMPAMYFGEERVSIDAEICPELRDGLITAMGWLHHWFYKPEHKLFRIEAGRKHKVSPLTEPPRAGIFFSGGIDALGTLRANHLNYPSDHPGYIKDGILVCGLEVRDADKFEHVFSSVSALAQDAGINLIPVYTNIRNLGPDDDEDFWRDFWVNEFMGPCFAAIAHAFSKRFSVVSINSSYDIPNQIPHGLHPMIDPNCSSSDLRIRHEGITLSRFDKTKLIAGWDVALKYLRVCNRSELYESNVMNCGSCEKCVRTRLALLASGAPEKIPAFPDQHITADLINKAVTLAPNTFVLYEELLAPLAEIGRYDLVHAIKLQLARYHKSQKKQVWRKSLIDPVLKFDEKHFKGNLRKVKRFIYPSKGIWTNP